MRVFIASLLAAIVLFFFGFLWWGILMPVVKPAKVISDQALVESMSSSLNVAGTYFYPDYSTQDVAATGPMAIVFFDPDMPAMGTMMGMGFGHMFATALLASLCTYYLRLRTFNERLAFVFFLGLFVAVWADVGNLIWWRHPPGWTAYHFGYDLGSWLLAGLIIAAIVKPAAIKAGE